MLEQLLIVSSLITGQPAPPDPKGTCEAIQFSYPEHDGLSQELVYELEKLFMRDNLTCANAMLPMRIDLNQGIATGRLGRMKIAIYRASFIRNNEVIFEKLGVCKINSIQNCSNDIYASFKKLTK